jgi:hypothetical protein
LKIGGKGQDGGYQGGPNGVGPLGIYKRKTKSLAFLFLFKIGKLYFKYLQGIEN